MTYLTLLLSLCTAVECVSASGRFVCSGSGGWDDREPAAKTLQGIPPFLPSQGHLEALVVFAKFRDEAPKQTSAPALARNLFDPDKPGSFTHFYQTMSHGRLWVEGEFLPRRYSSAYPTLAYLSTDPTRSGAYGQFVQEVLAQVDRDVDFGRFDNDGADGIPNSGDDDGIVDYLFMSLISTPRYFLLNSATGIVGLGFEGFYETQDKTPGGRPLRIGGERRWGTVFQGGNFTQTVGVMAHEFGHSLGLPDLFDGSFLVDPGQMPAEDGAGIGKWGLMGLGTLGWNGDDGPVGFCAWSLKQLGWIGRDNDRLREIVKSTEDLVVGDLFQGGDIIKVLLKEESTDNTTVFQDYLLLETRMRSAHYYNRHLPAEGLLIWHVRGRANSNADERKKMVDLVCADGLYADGGYPVGQITDPHRGGDNLDFWAHDELYARTYAGNTGDATDPFDGVRFTRFDERSNPSTNVTGEALSSAEQGVSIENIHRRGETMVVDVHPRRWAGVIREEVNWVGHILVDGDLAVAPEGRLIIGRDTQVRFAGQDRLRTGLDPALCELHVQGDLVLPRSVRNMGGNIGISFAALDPGDRWYGIVIDPAEGTELLVSGSSMEVTDAEHGVTLPGAPPGTNRLAVDSYRFFDGLAMETAGNGDGRLGPGESFRIDVDLVNWSLDAYADTRVELRWNSPLLRPLWKEPEWSGYLTTEEVDILAWGRQKLSLPSLTVGREIPPGRQAEFIVDITANINGQEPRRRVSRDTLVVELAEGYAGEVLHLVAPHVDSPENGMLLPLWRQSRIEVSGSHEIQRVDLVVSTFPGLQPVLETRMVPASPKDGGRHFTGTFTPPRADQYLLAFRIHDRNGQVYFSPEHLEVVSLFSRWQPLLVILDPEFGSVQRNSLIAGLVTAAAALGMETTTLDLKTRAPDGVLYEPILDEYLQEGRVVVWMGGEMDAPTEESFGSFLDRGGKLLILQNLSGAGFSAPPLQDRLHIIRMTLTRGTRLSGADGEEIGDVGYYPTHVQLELGSWAAPLLVDEEQVVAAMRLATDTYRVVYLPLYLSFPLPQSISQLWERSLRFLKEPSSPSGHVKIIQVLIADDVQPSTALTPRLVIANPGQGTSEPVQVGYRIVHGEEVLFSAGQTEEPLAAGETREVSLPPWQVEEAGDLEIHLGLTDSDREMDYSWVQSLPLERPDSFYERRSLRTEPVASNGAGSFDYDGDGDLDIYLVRQGAPNLLYRNDGGDFVETGATARIDNEGKGRGLAFADYDGDGHVDLYLVNEGSNRFFVNQGDGAFREASAELSEPVPGAPSLADEKWGRSAAFFDHDLDGDLDLYVTNVYAPNRFFENRDGTFVERAAALGLADMGTSKGLAAGDYDDDGDIDLFVANQPPRPSQLYRNDRGYFSGVAERSGISGAEGEVGAVFADYDGDGRLDLFVANERSANRLYHNCGDGTFQAQAMDLGGYSVGMVLFDFDNDGDLDLAATALDSAVGGDEMYENREAEGFLSVGAKLGLRSASSGRAITFGDYDGNGYPDLLVADAWETQLYFSAGHAYNWLDLELEGRLPNRQGIGAKVQLWAAGQEQYREQHLGSGYCGQRSPYLHFGLGETERVDRVQVTWPDGRKTVFLDIAANQWLRVPHPHLETVVSREGAANPRSFSLSQNFPNPFNGNTSIRFTLPTGGDVELAVYDLIGQPVATLVKGAREAGTHSARWNGRADDGRPLASGVYLYRLQTSDGKQVETRKLVLAR